MLVLSRKVGERILVGDQIRITVVRLTNGGVRLGIEAPADMSVLREEVKRQDRMSRLKVARPRWRPTHGTFGPYSTAATLSRRRRVRLPSQPSLRISAGRHRSGQSTVRIAQARHFREASLVIGLDRIQWAVLL